MAVTINADNGVSSGSAGLKQTADSTGVLALQTNGTTAVTVDTSQNVGIGTTSPTYRLDAQANTYQVAQFKNTNAVGGDAQITLTATQSGNGGALNASANYVAFQIASSEKARIDSSGKVGIGTNNPQGQLHVNGGYAGFQYNSAGTYPAYNTYFGAIGTNFQVGASYLDFWNTVGSGFQWHIQTAASTQTSVMTIDSSGNLIVGSTSTSPNPGVSINSAGSLAIGNNAAGSGYTFQYFLRSTTIIGSITQNGTTTVSYNTTSDYRLKENVQPMTGALARVAALKPCTYTWKSAPDETGEGFIAHELAEICPQAVSGEKDAVNEDGSIKPQGIDTSFLVATLTAAIQEMKQIVDAQAATLATQAAEIAALKGTKP